MPIDCIMRYYLYKSCKTFLTSTCLCITFYIIFYSWRVSLHYSLTSFVFLLLLSFLVIFFCSSLIAYTKYVNKDFLSAFPIFCHILQGISQSLTVTLWPATLFVAFVTVGCVDFVHQQTKMARKLWTANVRASRPNNKGVDYAWACHLMQHIYYIYICMHTYPPLSLHTYVYTYSCSASERNWKSAQRPHIYF